MVDYKVEFFEHATYELDLSPATVKQYMWRLGHLEKLFGRPIEEVTSDDLRALRRRWRQSSSMLKTLFVAIKSFHKWGALEGHWQLNGIALLRTPKEVNRISRPLTHDEIAAIKEACVSPLDFRLVYPGSYAGFRIGESAQLPRTWWQGELLVFHGEKTLMPRQIPVHPKLQAVCDIILSRPPCHPGSLQKVKERLEKRCGVRFVAHQLRKSFSSSLYDDDVPDEVVKDLLGHVGDVTRRYAPVSLRKKRWAVAKVPY